MRNKMNRMILLAGAVFLLWGVPAPVASSSALAADMSHSAMGHGGQGAPAAMQHSTDMGEMIHQATVEGYELTFRLIDMMEKMKDMTAKMPAMPQMKDTHHLMAFIRSPHGHAVEKAQVGYLIKAPNGTEQRAMCMAMNNGFGGDVNLSQKGIYTVYVKAVVDATTTLTHNFEYEVK